MKRIIAGMEMIPDHFLALDVLPYRWKITNISHSRHSDMVAMYATVLPTILAILQSAPGLPSAVKTTASKKQDTPTIISMYLSML